MIDDRLRAYLLAVLLVEHIDFELECGRHFHTRGGRPIFYLDQAVNAILANDFAPLPEQRGLQNESAVPAALAA